LAEVFAEAEEDFRSQSPPNVPADTLAAINKVVESATQSYREALVGCILARLLDRAVNIRYPYATQDANAFNGRTLDEQVVNPFLHDKLIPCSRGPYLATFRRNIKFVPRTVQGLRDKDGYRAFLAVISTLERASADSEMRDVLRLLLFRFVELREAANITLVRIQRLSLEQYATIIGGLLSTPSGGLLPVLFSVAMFNTIKRCFNLDWEIQWQGINVADRASGAGGDITIRQNQAVVLAVEVTERPIDRSRVVSTFNAKILPHGIADYLFLFGAATPDGGARAAGQQYFSQGHDMSFLPIREWLVNCLGTIGSRCRPIFMDELLGLLDNPSIPAAVKVAFNERVRGLTTPS
jgi:hypothetical protein